MEPWPSGAPHTARSLAENAYDLEERKRTTRPSCACVFDCCTLRQILPPDGPGAQLRPTALTGSADRGALAARLYHASIGASDAVSAAAPHWAALRYCTRRRAKGYVYGSLRLARDAATRAMTAE